MALVLENGSGVFGANSYVLAAFVTAYLAERNRAGEGGWSTGSPGAEEDAACIAGTDYIENRNRDSFLGMKEFRSISTARATLTFAAQPSPTETVTIGGQVYTFVSSLSGSADVLIGSSVAATLSNLVAAVMANADEAGTTFSAALVANPDATAVEFYDDTVVAYAKATGTAGNAVATTTTVTGGAWNFATLVGGSDVARPQPLSFPRVGLYDRDGIRVVGIPDRLKFATAEYAVRARAAALAPDPTVDALGGVVTSFREKVGPIETATEYLAGTAGSGALPAYPAADRLLRDYLGRRGRLIRG